MKPSTACPVFALILSACFTTFSSLIAQPSFEVGASAAAPLGLQRLSREVAPEKFEVIDFSSVTGSSLFPGKLGTRGGALYLELEPDAEWSRSLGNRTKAIYYLTFTANVSINTVLTIGSVRILTLQSRRDPTYVALFRSEPTAEGLSWTPLNHEIPTVPFGGVLMATLDVATIQINDAANTWSLWFRDTSIAHDIPLAASRVKADKFTLTAGEHGAWLCALIISEVNPLFVDLNNNGIPDDFESSIFGEPLPSNVSRETLNAARAAWAEERKSRVPSEFISTTPLPDVFPDWCAPDGAAPHAMPGGIKFSIFDSQSSTAQ